jgi:hypothetical protein
MKKVIVLLVGIFFLSLSFVGCDKDEYSNEGKVAIIYTGTKYDIGYNICPVANEKTSIMTVWFFNNEKQEFDLNIGDYIIGKTGFQVKPERTTSITIGDDGIKVSY